ncbi:MAG TPA: hypothetical protein DGT21_09815 [Armatimonadetes bacterium]|nr:hypothetical protein [Armatimonadota bacterium]
MLLGGPQSRQHVLDNALDGVGKPWDIICTGGQPAVRGPVARLLEGELQKQRTAFRAAPELAEHIAALLVGECAAGIPEHPVEHPRTLGRRHRLHAEQTLLSQRNARRAQGCAFSVLALQGRDDHPRMRG